MPDVERLNADPMARLLQIPLSRMLGNMARVPAARDAARALLEAATGICQGG
jgi:hypothetical protein